VFVFAYSNSKCPVHRLVKKLLEKILLGHNASEGKRMRLIGHSLFFEVEVFEVIEVPVVW